MTFRSFVTTGTTLYIRSIAVLVLLGLSGAVAPRKVHAARGLDADFNGDGYDDLAIGSPGENLVITIGQISVPVPDAGVVHVIYGGAGGLQVNGVPLPPQVFTESILGAGDGSESGDQFGASLATGRFNNDAYDDLAIGVPGEDRFTMKDTGAVCVIYGSPAGLVASNSQCWFSPFVSSRSLARDEAQLTVLTPAGDRFGYALTAGDFNGDGYDELSVGAPYHDLNTEDLDVGRVVTLIGSSAGLTGSFDDIQGRTPGGHFGMALAAGNFDNDGCDDLAFGAPGDDPVFGPGGEGIRSGAVWVVYGDCEPPITGLFAGVSFWSQDSVGVPDVAEDGDAFGAALAAGDFDGDTFDDLAIGAKHEDLRTPPLFLPRRDAGVVHVLYGGGQGLSAAGPQRWSQLSPDLFEDAETGDWFGRSLAAGDFNNDGRDDLAIGVRESFMAAPYAGLVHVLYGGSSGLSAAYAQQWHQNSHLNLGMDSEPNDGFGQTVFAGDFDGNGAFDLAIGAPGEDAGAGVVQVLYGQTAIPGPGLTLTADRWSQSSTGLGMSEPGDGFGGALPGSRDVRPLVILVAPILGHLP